MPGPKCRVCCHRRRSIIDRELVSRWRREGSFRDIARRHGLSKDSVFRHFCEHIPKSLWEGEKARRWLGSDNLLQVLTDEANECRKLRQAASAALQDPEDPDRLTLDPRPEDISVVYVTLDGEGAPVKMREKLSVILRRFAKREKVGVVSWTITRADPGAQLVAAGRAFADFASLIARIKGELKDVLLVEDSARIQALAQGLLSLIPAKDLPKARELLDQEKAAYETWN